VSEPIRTLPKTQLQYSLDSMRPGFPPKQEISRGSVQVTASAFVVLFCVVGMALWGLPFYYDFMGGAVWVDARAGHFRQCAEQTGSGGRCLDLSLGGW